MNLLFSHFSSFLNPFEGSKYTSALNFACFTWLETFFYLNEEVLVLISWLIFIVVASFYSSTIIENTFEETREKFYKNLVLSFDFKNDNSSAWVWTYTYEYPYPWEDDKHKIDDLEKISEEIKEMRKFLGDFAKEYNPQDKDEDYPLHENDNPQDKDEDYPLHENNHPQDKDEDYPLHENDNPQDTNNGFLILFSSLKDDLVGILDNLDLPKPEQEIHVQELFRQWTDAANSLMDNKAKGFSCKVIVGKEKNTLKITLLIENIFPS